MKKILLSVLLASALFSQETTKIQKSENLSLTIYNNNLAMINEERAVNINNTGSQKLIYEGIPSSVIFESIIPYFSKPTTLYSQNYHYDILSLNKLLEKHINKEVIYKNYSDDYTYKRETAVLLSLNPILLQKNQEIISGIKTTDIIFSKLPNDLITKPSLVWKTRSEKGNQKIKLNYLTRNISWKSDYILNLDEKNSLNAWITIQNNSGSAYKNANIHVIAGDVKTNRRIVRKSAPRYEMAAMNTMADSPKVAQKSFSGYHLYTIPFKETINNNEKKQINFINKSNLKVQSKATSNNGIYFHRFSKIKGQNFNHKIELNNTKEAGLGLALPSGTVRVYKKDEGISHFIGEDNIKHTSKNAEISLTIGKFFDITQDVTQLFNKKTKESVRTKYSRLIENKTDKPRLVEITETVYSNNVKNIVTSNTCKNNCTVKKEGLNTYKYIINLKAQSKYKFVVDYELFYSQLLRQQ